MPSSRPLGWSRRNSTSSNVEADENVCLPLQPSAVRLPPRYSQRHRGSESTSCDCRSSRSTSPSGWSSGSSSPFQGFDVWPCDAETAKSLVRDARRSTSKDNSISFRHTACRDPMTDVTDDECTERPGDGICLGMPPSYSRTRCGEVFGACKTSQPFMSVLDFATPLRSSRRLAAFTPTRKVDLIRDPTDCGSDGPPQIDLVPVQPTIFSFDDEDDLKPSHLSPDGSTGSFSEGICDDISEGLCDDVDEGSHLFLPSLSTTSREKTGASTSSNENTVIERVDPWAILCQQTIAPIRPGPSVVTALLSQDVKGHDRPFSPRVYRPQPTSCCSFMISFTVWARTRLRHHR